MSLSSHGVLDPSTQYQAKRIFTLYKHDAPHRPPPNRRENIPFDVKSRALEKEPNGRLQNCRDRRMQPLSNSHTVEVTLEKALTLGSHQHYVQVWKVECEGKAMVARFYDPLYAGGSDIDIFKQMNDTIAIEASAYEVLKDLQGTVVPCFMGCFLAMLADAEEPVRSVQVVLLEYIPGKDLLHIGRVCDDHKSAIIDAISVARHLLVLHGVLHSDVAERNIILKDIPDSPHQSCGGVAPCDLRRKFPTESLLQQMNIPGLPAFDYSTLTPQQLHSLPIAIIDFECVHLVDDVIAELERLSGRRPKRLVSRKQFEDKRRPERLRDAFFEELQKEGSKLLPSTHKDVLPP
ncbi:hypothetical protein C8R43DRAFT_160739 [Mycena crocata]|nr:hypothetical protein C8R43DRAFT_160739 [Mycena crocata]